MDMIETESDKVVKFQKKIENYRKLSESEAEIIYAEIKYFFNRSIEDQELIKKEIVDRITNEMRPKIVELVNKNIMITEEEKAICNRMQFIRVNLARIEESRQILVSKRSEIPYIGALNFCADGANSIDWQLKDLIGLLKKEHDTKKIMDDLLEELRRIEKQIEKVD